MSMGQALLALGAITLFMYTAVNVNRTYVAASAESVAQQRNLDIINYTQSLSEFVYAQGPRYSNLDVIFANSGDINDPSKHLTHITTIRDTLFSTIQLSAEGNMIHGAKGRSATIRVYTSAGGTKQQRVETIAVIINPED